ncbi:hypothetical protein DPMN_121262 [Dreissena polymorpha]|uniref:NACHT domain-containing protein n=3 Tax=Dreissena polymorpha TaxID=45954 RepID=A0A9D4GQ65_DREPO|nr:hypothetical protein DPMN_121262 [Dreissena polymorpha]
MKTYVRRTLICEVLCLPGTQRFVTDDIQMAEYGGEGEGDKLQLETVRMVLREEINEALHDFSIGPVHKRDERANDIEAEYQQKCRDFLGRLKEYYKKTMKMLPVSPIWYGREKSIMDIFVPIQLNHIALEKNGSRRDTEQKVDTYKDMFYKNTTLSDRVSIQGDPGMGKTTFLAKLVLNWCDSDSTDPEPSSKFSDVETLQNFRFLFHIKLRDSIGQSKVVNMIKTQIIDEIYFNEKQQREAYDLLGSILERETCLVTMDGLNEWTDHTQENPIPKLYSLSKQCVVLTTSRPWKMADKRIRDSEIGTLIEAVGITETEQLIRNLLRSMTEDDQVSYKEFMAYVKESKLNHFLASPWMLTLLVNLWVDKTFLSGSLCEINKVLIYTLFNKELPEDGLTEHIPSENAVFEHHTEICNALARVAFNFTIGSEKSLVLSKQDLLSTGMLSNKQLEFAIRSGVLSERHCFSAASCKSQVSFLHETIQEFFAASHIATLPDDTITNIFCKSKYNVLEISHVIIYLSGLKCDVANKVIQYLTEDVFNDVNTELDWIRIGSDDTYTTLRYYVVNRLMLSLVQDIMISCYQEANVSREKHFRLEMSDFIFKANVNKKKNDDLLQILMMNTSNIRTLSLERSVIQEHTILTVLQQSTHCIERLKTPISRAIISALHNLNVKQLALIGNSDVSLFSELLPSMINLTLLLIEESDFNKDNFPPPSVENVSNVRLPILLEHVALLNCKISLEWLCSLLITLSSLDHHVKCTLSNVVLHLHKETRRHESRIHVSDLRSEIMSHDMSNIEILVDNVSKELFEILRDTRVRILDLRTAECALDLMKDSPGLYETLPTINITSLNMTKIEHPDMLSQTLPLLTNLQQLRICLKRYMEIKLPESLKYVFIIYTTFSPTSLQNFVQDMYTAKQNVDFKLLFRVEGNEDEYTRINQEVCKLDTVEVQQFDVVDKRHYCGVVAATATLFSTADETDDDFDKHLLRREGYVDSRTWLHYCKIRLHVSLSENLHR